MRWKVLLGCFSIWLASQPAFSLESAKTVAFQGTITRGKTFKKPFADDLIFCLRPDKYGFHIVVYDKDKPDESLIATPPYHGINSSDIEGWFFRNGDNTKANDGSVNAPQHEHDFIFSKRLGIRDVMDAAPETYEKILDQIESDGSGMLTITKLKLGNLTKGQHAWIDSMAFTVRITYR